jgi:hypothetical protein
MARVGGSAVEVFFLLKASMTQTQESKVLDRYKYIKKKHV